MTKPIPTESLAAAVDALGEIMSALNARRLLAMDRPLAEMLRESLKAKALTDEQLLDIAADAFQAGGLALFDAGAPGVTVRECSGGVAARRRSGI